MDRQQEETEDEKFTIEEELKEEAIMERYESEKEFEQEEDWLE